MHSKEIKGRINDTSIVKAARMAGLMFLCGLLIPALNWIFILSRFIVTESGISTAHNILANEFVFRIGIINEVITAVVIIILSIALYYILKPINKYLALLAFILKLVDAFLTLVLALGHLVALQILNSLSSMATTNQENVQGIVGQFLNIHVSLTSIQGMFLGLSMSIFLYLLFKSKYIPNALAVIGILSYVLIFIYDLLFFLLPTISSMPVVQIIGLGPNILFTLIIGSWLLIKGLNFHKV